MASDANSREALFRLNAGRGSEMTLIGGQLPVLLIDDVFADPLAVREHALRLPFTTPRHPYPGRVAQPDPEDASLMEFLRTMLDLVNHKYLPNVPRISTNGQPISRFSQVETDFALIDLHPDELQPVQRAPHVDPVPIFGLVYLNEVERGGTLFFNRSGVPAESERSGYFSQPDPEYSLIGTIEGRFNRLAIYPGFVPHSGEIRGEWISNEERFKIPRLTQRMLFIP